MSIKNNIGTFENSHIRFAVTEPIHKRSSFCQGITGGLAGGLMQKIPIVKNAFKIAKLQSLTKKNTNKFHPSTI